MNFGVTSVTGVTRSNAPVVKRNGKTRHWRHCDARDDCDDEIPHSHFAAMLRSKWEGERAKEPTKKG
jgi:hypothetical protein